MLLREAHEPGGRQSYGLDRGSDHLPVAQIPALLDHVQNVGLSAGAGQTWEKQDRGPGGRIRMREAVVVVKPIQGNLSSICCLNELTAETRGTLRSLCLHNFPPVSVTWDYIKRSW